MRHHYLTTLKGTYSHFYEDSQCSSASIMLLNESVDRALDHDSNPIKDWEFIHSYVISYKYARMLRCLKKVPLIGFYFKTYLFHQFSFVYDVIVNMIEGHEKAGNMMMEQFPEEQCLG